MGGTNLTSTARAEERERPAIAGVEILELAGRGRHSTVHRGHRAGVEVAIKRGPWGGLHAGEPARLFAAEAAALCRIRHASVASLIDSGIDEEGHPYLIMRWLPGQTLAQRLTQGPLSVEETLRLLERLADALRAVHRAGVVHRDINPANVILDERGWPTLIDFGLATKRDDALSRAVGTLAYTAPEQSGSLHLSVDHRADLYALGAVAHECLMGEPPFGASDAETLLRMHARSMPTPVHEARSDVPPRLGEVIRRLLAKDPEDRYQTAASLLWDLTHLSELRHESDLAKRHVDRARELALPLRGRDAVLDKLLNAVPRKGDGHGATLVVSGAHGSGVSRMGNKLLWLAADSRTVLVARATPHAALLSVVHAWLARLNATLAQGDDSAREQLRTRLLTEVGPVHEGLLREFPMLASLLTVDERGGELPPKERVYDTIVQIVASVAGHVSGLTLVLDDAEHVDGASAAVLRRLSWSARSRPITLVLLTHDPEAKALLDSIEGATSHITLAPLDLPSAHALVSDFLSCPDLDHAISEVLLQSSGGQPGGLLELATTLLEGGALQFHDDAFHLDNDRLQKLALPDNVAELAQSRARSLEPEIQQLLGVAALHGGPFDVDLVAEAAASEPLKVMRAITVALEARIVRTHDDLRFQFVDLRVSDWLSAQVSDSARSRAHQVYAAKAEREPDDVGLMRAATHRFRGADAKTADACIAICIRAGARACEQTAWIEARTLLDYARSLSERFSRPLDSAFYRLQGIALASSGDTERGLACFEEAIACCDVPFQRAELNLHVAEMHMGANFDIDRMEVNLERSWRDLGERLPRNTPLQLWGLFLLPLATLIMERTGLGVGQVRDQAAARLRCRLIEATLKWAYLKNHIFVLLGMIFRPFYQALRVGSGAELAVGYAAHASTLASLGLPPASVKSRLDKAYALAKELGDRVALTRVEYWDAIADSQQGHMAKSADKLETLLSERGRWMNINDYFFAAVDVSINLSLRGYNLRAVNFLQRCLDDLVARSGAETAAARLCRDLLVANRLNHERPQDASKKFDDEVGKLANVPPSSFLWFQVWFSRLGLWFETGDRGRYDEGIEAAERSGRKAEFAGWQFSHFWVLKGMCRAEQALHESGKERERRVRQIEEAIKELKVPSKFPFVACNVELLRGLVAYFRGDVSTALTRLGAAEAGSIHSDNAIARYQVLVARARILRELGQLDAAVLDARQALQLCELQGWRQWAVRTREELELGASGRLTSVSSESQSSRREHGGAALSPEALRLRRERDALLDVGQATAAVSDPTEQAAIALERLRALFGAERALWCAVSAHEGLALTAACTDDVAPVEDEGLKPLWAEVLHKREAVVLNGEDEIARRAGSLTAERGVRSLICAPVLLRDEPVGVVTLDTRVARGAFTAEDVDVLAAVATQIAIGQETAASMQRELQRQALERDLQLSAAVQGLLLPRDAQIRLGSLETLGYFLPASRAAGDFWYAEPTSDGRLRAFVGDVTGHGAGAAMVTAVLAGAYRGLVDTGKLSTQQLLEGLDGAVKALCDGSYTVAFCAIEIDPRSGQGWLWTGASPAVLIRDVHGGVRSVSGPGAPLGAGEGIASPISFELAPGELLWMFSDGLNELPMPNGRELGLRRLHKMLEKPSSDELSRRSEELMEQVRVTADMSKRDDDLTFVLVKRAAALEA